MIAGNVISLPDELRKSLQGSDTFDAIMQLQGQAFRDVPGRKTMRVMLAGKPYFIKQHFGVGWHEIIKNLLSFKRPVLGALTEVAAIQKLDEIGVSTTPLVGYGRRGRSPATQQSFLITEDLGDIISLEELCATWLQHPPEPDFKKKIIAAMAELAARLHGAGVCHRDFYLCHLVMKKHELDNGKIHLILIDLHRMLMKQSSDASAVMKDIAALYFSSMNYGFTREDWQLFRQHYLPQSAAFWNRVERRAHKLYQKFHSSKFQQRLVRERASLDSSMKSN